MKSTGRSKTVYEPGQRIESVLVVGGGSAGLLAAVTLKSKLPDLQVSVVHSSKIGTIGVGEGTTPLIPAHLHGYLNLDPSEFLRETGSSWKLGIRFEWGRRPFFDYTFTHQLDWRWSRLSKCNGFYCDQDAWETDVASALMSAGKACLRKDDGDPLIERNFGYHADNQRLVGYFDRIARDLGVKFIDATIADVDTSDRGVHSLQLDSGESLAADLFVDASGFRSILLGETLGEDYLDFGETLFCDRAVVGSWDRRDEPVLPYTTAETMESGWCWQIEHPDHITRGYVYAGAFLDDDAAEEEFRRKNPRVGPTRLIRFSSGRYRRPWRDNVVAIGNAAGFVEPLEATALHCICHSCRLLADGLADSQQRPGPALRTVYNRSVTEVWDQIRWFLGLHYKFNRRIDSPFWRAALADIKLGPAQVVVDFYRENGPSLFARDAVLNPGDIFGMEGYLTLLVGMGVAHHATFDPPESEQAIWRQVQREHQARAAAGFSIKELNEVVQHPRWEWYPGYFSDDGRASFHRSPLEA